MGKSKITHWMLTVMLALAGQVYAQYRVGSDGRALDANNRIGSGGINEGSSAGQQVPYGYLGNNIVTGNITAGREFRGFVPYSNPTAFRGPTAGGLSDRFIRNSTGVPYGGISQNNAQVVQPFYGISNAAPPPPGFVQQSLSSGAYVPAPSISPTPSDMRLGRPLEPLTPTLPQPGQLVLPGPVDPNTQTSSLITASPLYGVRQWKLGDKTDQEFIENNLLGAGTGGLKIDPAMLEQLRRELRQTVGGEQQQTQQQDLEGPLPKPFESPQDQPLSSAVTIRSGQADTAQPLDRALATGESVKLRLLIPPEQQSTQYAELQQRLRQYRVARQMQQQQEQQQLDQQLRQMQAGQPAGPGESILAGPGGPPGQSAATATPSTPPGADQVAKPPASPAVAPAQPPAQPAVGPRPLQIRSLAEGVQARGLAELLKEAEDLMKAGRYNSALEQYELAETVAPNNPMILLGRAIAELGQSYYTRAEAHLRQAFMKDQALLMGQYDLKSLIGQERMQFLISDLKEIAKRESRESRPVFLLAFIAYNTGNERLAAAYLTLADQRAGGSDPLIALVRKHWTLPADQSKPTGDELNK